MKSDSTRSLMKATKELPRRKRQNRGRGGQNSSFLLRFEGLEERAMLSAMSVVNTADSGAGSLRQAILDANAQEGADFIQFAESAQGTISLTSGQLAVTDELTINGPGAEMLTVSGSGNSRVFHVAGTTVAIDDITIADGLATDLVPESADLAPFAAGGGLLNLGGNVTLTNVQVVGNTAQGYLGSGGGVSNWFGASMTVNQSTFADNEAFGLGIGGGGAISSSTSQLTVNDSTFTGNKAIAGTGFNPDVRFSGLAAGGAISNADGTTVSITNSQFENNIAKAGDGIEGTGQGGGFAIGGAMNAGNTGLTGRAQSTLNVTGSTFSGNQVIGGKGANGPDGVRGGNGGPAFSGAIHLVDGIQATVTNSEFNGNQVITGDGGNGGAGADGGESGNYNDTYVGSHSGAMTIDGGDLTVIDSSFSDNVIHGGNGGQGGTGGDGGHSARATSGAISVSPWDGVDTVSVNMTNVTLTNNTVVAGHGGTAGDSGARDGRDGEAKAGGLHAESDFGTAGLIFVTMTDSTITGNVTQGSSDAMVNGAGLLANIGANVTLTNVNISQNKEITDGVEVVVDGYACEGILTADGNCVAAQQGDANKDGQFDRADIEQVLQAGKYGTDEDAVWSEGDWNRDGRFDQADIIAALQANNYVA